jgi:hypothetical protein
LTRIAKGRIFALRFLCILSLQAAIDFDFSTEACKQEMKSGREGAKSQFLFIRRVQLSKSLTLLNESTLTLIEENS